MTLLREIFPLILGGRVRRETAKAQVSKRKRRRAEFAKTQDLWKKSPGLCMRTLLKDKTTDIEPDPDIMIPFWKNIMETKDLSSPGIGVRREPVKPLWAPVQKDEIKNAFPNLGTASGPDKVSARQLRSVPYDILIRVLNIFMITEELPQYLLESRTTLIPKKDGAKEPGDFRPIAVSSVITRLFHKILANRIMVHIKTDSRQKAFKQVDGCAENIFLLDLVLRKHRESFRPIFIASMDVAKAFDSVTHQTICDTMITMGFPQQMVNYIMSTYDKSKTKLCCGSWESESIRPACGVKQGDPLSPPLFILVIERLLEKLPQEVGTRIGNTVINVEAFADDLVLFATTERGLQTSIDIAADFLLRCGLRVNTGKTFTVTIRGLGKEKKSLVDVQTKFNCGGRVLPSLQRDDQWRYLGVQFTSEGRVLGKVLDNLNETILTLTKAPLKPQQRLFGLRTVVLPALYHQLVLGWTNISVLKKADIKIRTAVRRWLNLPKDTVVPYFHADVKDGGLSIPSLRWNVPQMRLKRLKNLGLSETGTLEDTVFLRREISKATERIRDRGVPINSAYKIAKRWGSLLHASIDGKALQRSKDVPQQHMWIIEGNKFLTGKDFINMARLRINSLPVKARTTRGRTRERRCRAGCAESETLNHVVQRCHRTHEARIRRHDAITKYLVRNLEKDWTSVEEEPHFQTSEGLRKPDILAVRGKAAVIIDAAVTGEQSDLKGAHEAKIKKYQPLRDVIQQRYRVENVIFMSATISCRGVWCKESVEDLLRVGAIRRSDLKVLSTRVLLGGLAAFRIFNRMTTTSRPRVGIG